MNARVAAVLVVLLAVLGGSALLLYQQERARQPAAADALGQPVLPGLQAADIATLVIREPGATLTLQRRDPNWAIAERAGFSADLGAVRQLVLSVLGLKVGSREPIADQDRARLGLDGKGTQLEFRGADGKTLAALVVGKKYFKREPEDADKAPGDGRFVLLPGSPNSVIVVADPLCNSRMESPSDRCNARIWLRCSSNASRPTPDSVPCACSVMASAAYPRCLAAATISFSVERPSPDSSVWTWKSPSSAPAASGSLPASAASISPQSSRSTGGMSAKPRAR
jgi:hypothetical protein